MYIGMYMMPVYKPLLFIKQSDSLAFSRGRVPVLPGTPLPSIGWVIHVAGVVCTLQCRCYAEAAFQPVWKQDRTARPLCP
jgi:hypothetical protein